jgi:hypothetical protein
MRKLSVCVDVVAVAAVAVVVVVAVMAVDLLPHLTLPHVAHVLHKPSLLTHFHPLALMDTPNRSRKTVAAALFPHHMCTASIPAPIVVANAAPIDSATMAWLALLYLATRRLHRLPLHQSRTPPMRLLPLLAPLSFQTQSPETVATAPLALHISMELIPVLIVVVVEARTVSTPTMMLHIT